MSISFQGQLGKCATCDPCMRPSRSACEQLILGRGSTALCTAGRRFVCLLIDDQPTSASNWEDEVVGTFLGAVALRIDELLEANSGGKPASQAYWNALRKLRGAWREVFDEELEAHGHRAMETFENALVNLKLRLKQDAVGGKRLLDVLDVQPDEDIEDVLLGWADLDDLTPNRIKAAMLSELHKCGKGRFELRPILRAVLDKLFDHSTTRRPRVAANRHWPRLLQYLRELEEATDWSPDGRGMRLANVGGRGPVAHDPRDPSRLSVVVDPDYL